MENNKENPLREQAEDFFVVVYIIYKRILTPARWRRERWKGPGKTGAQGAIGKIPVTMSVPSRT